MTVIRDISTGKVRLSLVEDNAFLSAIEGLQDFVLNINADCEMAYDWVCDQAGIQSFVADTPAWDLFFETFTSVDAWQTGTRGVAMPPRTCYITFVPEKSNAHRFCSFWEKHSVYESRQVLVWNAEQLSQMLPQAFFCSDGKTFQSEWNQCA